MTTLKNIAEELGLSPATISRALNGFPEVSVKTRALVEQTASRLNYRPNPLAKKLVSGRSGMVGLILKPVEARSGDTSLFDIMTGLSEQLAMRDIDLVFQSATGEDQVAPYRRMVEKNVLDGFILNAPEVNDPRIGYLQEMGVPFVVHGRAGAADYAFFDVDNRQVTKSSVELLANLGHEHIALINGHKKQAFAIDRAEGFAAALAARGLAMPATAIHYGPTTESFGYTATLALLSDQTAPRPTALVCASTITAAGAFRALKDLGLRIPADVSVIAHDDAMPDHRADSFTPALTVTRAPMRDACRPLAQAICQLLEGKPATSLQTIAQAEMIVRHSTGPAPETG